jgi:hypothetical protein
LKLNYLLDLKSRVKSGFDFFVLGFGHKISRVRSVGRNAFLDLDSPLVYSISDPEHREFPVPGTLFGL